MAMLWLRNPKCTFKLAVDPRYDPAECFATSELKLQGQLADLQELVPAKFYEDFSGDVLWNNVHPINACNAPMGALIFIMRQERQFFKCLNEDISDSFQHRKKIKELIGWTANANGSGRYKALAPILYKDYQGWHNKSTIFLNLILFQMYSTCPKASTFNSSTLEEVWGVDAITLGAIAAAAIFARFALSADIQLQPTGASTHIPYQENFEHYLKYLTDGLLKKKASVIVIFRSWNQEFYPHTTPKTNNTGEADDKSVQEALADLEADDEVEGSTGNVSDSGNERRNPGPDAWNQESTEHDPGVQEEDSLSHANE
ncbi:hypothetical protein K439DRAFT_1610340 [Ramaria rubella]|nr:hypothetical protein K439DRAFT_1610340 [Ramaria rubella]